jgi:hypothetical protein
MWLVNTGQLLSACSDDTVYLWNLRLDTTLFAGAQDFLFITYGTYMLFQLKLLNLYAAADIVYNRNTL